jgi:hypothetical protein
LPLSVWGLRGQGGELFGRGEALCALLNDQLPFLEQCMSSISVSVACAALNALNPNMGRVARLIAR